MKHFITAITDLGNYLMSLSDRTRLLLVLGGMLILGGGGIYKLIGSLQRLHEPVPLATPQQLIEPMKPLFTLHATQSKTIQQQRFRELNRLDSLHRLSQPANQSK